MNLQNDSALQMQLNSPLFNGQTQSALDILGDEDILHLPNLNPPVIGSAMMEQRHKNNQSLLTPG